MKIKSTIFLLSLLLLSLNLSSNSQAFINHETIKTFNKITLNKNTPTNRVYKENKSLEKVDNTQSRVYICGGKYAKKFHSRNNCRGLNNCRSEVYYYNSQQEAIDNGYKYCLICWK